MLLFFGLKAAREYTSDYALRTVLDIVSISKDPFYSNSAHDSPTRGPLSQP